MSVSKAPSPQALIDAIRNDDVEAVRQSLTPELLEQPIDAGGRHPLGMAVVAKSAQVVDLLLESGASPLYFDRTGLSPLDHGMAIADARILDHLRDGVERVRGRWQSRLARFARDYQALLAPLAAPEPEPVPDAGDILAFLTDGDQADAMAARLQQLCVRRAGQTPPDFPWLEHRRLLNDIGVLDAEKDQSAFLARWIMLETPFFSLPEQVAGRRAAGVSQLRFQVQMEAVTRAVQAGFLDAEDWIRSCVDAISLDSGPLGIISVSRKKMSSGQPQYVLENRLFDLVIESGANCCGAIICSPGAIANKALDALGERVRSIFGDMAGFIESLTPQQRKGVAASGIGARGRFAGWLELARLLAPHGLLPAGLPNDDDRQSWQHMAAWATRTLDDARILELLERMDDSGEVAHRQVKEELLACWLQTNSQGVGRLTPEHVSGIRDAAVLRGLIMNGACSAEVRDQALLDFGHVLDELALDEELLTHWHHACARIWCGNPVVHVPELWLQKLWEHRDQDDEPRLVLKALMQTRREPRDTCVESRSFALFLEWIREDPERADLALQRLYEDSPELGVWHYTDLPLHALTAAWEWFDPLARTTVSRILGDRSARLHSGPVDADAQALLRKCVAGHPGQWLSGQDVARQALPMLCEHGFEASLPYLPGLLRRKEFRDPALLGLSQIPFEQLYRSGLLQDADEAVRSLALRALCAHDSPAVAPLLRECLHQRDWEETQRGWILDRLEALGEEITSLDPLHGADLAAFESLAAAELKGKRSDPLERLWNARLGQMDLPFSYKALQWCARLLIEDDWEAVPRRVSQLWQFLTQEERAELTLRLVEAWGQSEADNKDRWVLCLVGVFGDDRLVLPLKELLGLSDVARYSRAIDVVHALAALDTRHALLVLEEASRRARYPGSVRTHLSLQLNEAAERRGLSLDELYDELVPTFDMGPDGLVLDVGPWCYRVQLLSDLSLRVTNGKTGRQTRSLPKAKPGEDPALRTVAENRFTLLKKSVKPVVKQVGARLTEAFECGKAWQVARWRTLFLEHPLLNLVGRSLVWSCCDGDSSCSFRISEDGSLIGLDDCPVTLGSGEVRLWHPLEASAEEIAGWRTHLADYELVPLIPQVEAPVHHLTPEEREQSALTRFCDCKVPWTRVKRLMARWGFRVSDQDGACVDGFARTWLSCRIRVDITAQWMYHLDGEEQSPIGEVVFIHGDGESEGNRYAYRSATLLPLGEVPPRLISTMIGKLTELDPSRNTKSWL